MSDTAPEPPRLRGLDPGSAAVVPHLAGSGGTPSGAQSPARQLAHSARNRSSAGSRRLHVIIERGVGAVPGRLWLDVLWRVDDGRPGGSWRLRPSYSDGGSVPGAFSALRDHPPLRLAAPTAIEEAIISSRTPTETGVNQIMGRGKRAQSTTHTLITTIRMLMGPPFTVHTVGLDARGCHECWEPGQVSDGSGSTARNRYLSTCLAGCRRRGLPEVWYGIESPTW